MPKSKCKKKTINKNNKKKNNKGKTVQLNANEPFTHPVLQNYMYHFL